MPRLDCGALTLVDNLMTDDLHSARYFSLATFRKAGGEVRTPVWFAEQADVFYVFSAGDAGKVKRLRREPRARVARCDVRGHVLGPWLEARGRLIASEVEIATALAALRHKYGVQMWLLDALSRITGRYDKRAYIAVTLAARGPDEVARS